MTQKPLTGRIAAERVAMRQFARAPHGLLAALRDLSDLTSTISDALDELGVGGAAPASTLTPLTPGRRLVGQAITLVNRRRTDTVAEARATGSRLADIECHNLAVPSDVLVIQGVQDISSMGALSALLGARQGELGAIVDGAVRDVSHFRALEYGVWARGASPITGKYRLESVSVNAPVEICGIVVRAGDVVVADDVGVCFIPFAQLADVCRVAGAIQRDEEERVRSIESGMSVVELANAARRKPNGQ